VTDASGTITVEKHGGTLIYTTQQPWENQPAVSGTAPAAYPTTGISSAIASNLERDRAGVSGVNLDEEAAKLLQFQQAYQASAKMIQIAQGIFDTLIQSMGR
jgi:flagellar hook protein FlgE